jgi:uncharacterized protein DUF6496
MVAVGEGYGGGEGESGEEDRHGGLSVKSGGKVQKVMREFKAGTLNSGSPRGPKVKNRKQAIAIALSEERRAKK